MHTDVPPGLLLFIAAIAVTPGPLNLLLLSVGLAGRRAAGLTVLAGASIGYGVLFGATAALARTLADVDARLFLAMQVAAALILARLAMRMLRWRPGGAAGADIAAGPWTGVAVVLLGGKAWTSALAAATLFCDPDHSAAVHAALFGGLAFVAVPILCGAWLFAGLALGRSLPSAAQRIVMTAAGAVLALMAAALVAEPALALIRS